jgi:hypothetical protein
MLNSSRSFSSGLPNCLLTSLFFYSLQLISPVVLGGAEVAKCVSKLWTRIWLVTIGPRARLMCDAHRA